MEAEAAVATHNYRLFALMALVYQRSGVQEHQHDSKSS